MFNRFIDQMQQAEKLMDLSVKMQRNIYTHLQKIGWNDNDNKNINNKKQ